MHKFLATLLICLSNSAAFAVCNSEGHKQFDFWLGDWDVYTQQGQLAGRNTITKILNGCVLQENYKTPTGYAGQSFNIFDESTGKWHQTWVDNGGVLLSLDGDFDGKSMVLEGKGIDQQGKPIKHRITWKRAADSSVRQHWQTSTDSGANWTTVFDGKYVKRKPEVFE